MRAALLTALVSLGVVEANATTISKPSDDEMVIGARAIVRGKVLSVSAALDPEQNRIFTYITIKVREVWKGGLTEKRLVLKEEGGRLADQGSIVYGTPQYVAGESVLLYLDTWRDGSFRTHQLFLGKFSLYEDRDSGRLMVKRAAADCHVVMLPGQASRGTATEEMELAAYRAMIQGRVQATYARSRAFEEANYAGIPMRAAPSEYGAQARSGGLQPQFALYNNTQPPRWFEPDSGRPVIFSVNPAGSPNAQIRNDITAAMNAWSNVEGCTLRLVEGGVTEACTNRNNVNVISFNDCDGRFLPTEECSRIVALGGLRWTTSQSKIVNGTLFYRATSAFIAFNPYSFCSFENHCDVQEITTHEIGHTLGLGHSQFADATMFSSAHFDGRCAALRADDEEGIRFVYPVEDGGSSPLEFATESELPDGLFGTYYFQVVIAKGGRLPYTFGVVPGLGRVPSGMSSTTRGHISGFAAAEGTFNFTMQVRDGNGAVVEKPFSIRIRPRAPGFDSHFTTQSVPMMVQAGQSFAVNLQWLNTGTPAWDGNFGFRLNSANPSGNTTWGADRILLADYFVASGQSLDVSFNLTAPTAPGTYNFQWQLFNDGIGLFGEPSANIAITVAATGTAPSVTSPAILDGAVGLAFSHQLMVTGGSAPFTWSLIEGTLPAGLMFNPANGLLSGTPTATGATALTVQVRDSQSRTAQKIITINILPPSLIITTAALPSVTRGVVYNQALSATGGTQPYTWSLLSGALPAGLTLTGNTITGTPTTAGTANFTVRVTDATSRTAQRDYAITVIPTTLSLEVAPLLETLMGSAFSYQPAASGGTLPYTWSVASGALPAGLSLNAGTGAITGTPTTSGTFTVNLLVRDQSAQSAMGQLQLKVLDPATVPVITKVVYKPGKKLTVEGERFHRNAVLMINASTPKVKFKKGVLVIKSLTLAPGRHEIRVINPDNVSSLVFVLTVV